MHQRAWGEAFADAFTLVGFANFVETEKMSVLNCQAHDEIRLLRTAEEFERMQPEWRALWSAAASAKPFQRPEWLVPWWHHFSQTTLYVATVRKAGRLVGLLPTYVYCDVETGERKLLLVGAGTSDYLDGVFAPECESSAIAAAMHQIAAEGSWDTAYFTQLPGDSRLIAVMRSFGAAPFAGESCSECPTLAVQDLPKKLRADVRFYRNAALGKGKLRLECADAHHAPAAFHNLVELHTARWQTVHQAGVLADPRVVAWHQEGIPLLEAVGCLRLYTLFLDEEAVAVLYALVDPPHRARRTVYHYLIGFAPAHAAWKPGLLLTAMASEHAVAEGVQVIDMLRGDEAYKRFWKVRETPTFGFALQRDRVQQSASPLQ